MSITFDAASGGNFISSTASLSHTIGTGANFLMVGVTSANKNLSVSDISYNGVAMTNNNTSEYTGGGESSLWYLVNPTAGANNIVVTYNSGTVANISVGGISLKGVDVAAPIGAKGTYNNGSSTNTSATITLTTQRDNSWIIDSLFIDTTAGISIGAGQTQRVAQTPVGGTSMRMSTIPTTTAGSNSVTWSFNNTDMAYAAAEVKELVGSNAIFFGTNF